MKPFASILRRVDVTRAHRRVSRLRLERSDSVGGCILADEDVFEERADSVDARHVSAISNIELTDSEIRWLHEATGELLAHMEDNK